jgi:hypothetical protein
MRDDSRSSTTSGSSGERRRNARRSVRNESPSTWASLVLGAGDGEAITKAIHLLGLMADAAKPRSSSISTIGPCGVSMAIAIRSGSARVLSISHSAQVRQTGAVMGDIPFADHTATRSSRQTRCFSLAQSNPTHHSLASSCGMTLLHSARATAIRVDPCTGAHGATSQWTRVAAVPPGHVCPGAQGAGGNGSLPAGRPNSGGTRRDLFGRFDFCWSAWALEHLGEHRRRVRLHTEFFEDAEARGNCRAHHGLHL